MRFPLARLSVACLALATLGAVLPAAAAGPQGVTPLPLPGNGSSLEWQAPQFLQADGKGRVFVLRGDTLDVYPVTSRGTLGEPERLRGTGSPDPEPLRAVMGTDRGEWLVFYGPGRPLLWFEGGKAELVADPVWEVEAVGLLRGDPIANVLPYRPGPGGAKAAPSGPPPSLITYRADRWSTLLAGAEAKDGGGAAPLSHRMESRMQRSAVLLGSKSGRLWVGQLYRYRLQRLSPAGKAQVELTVDGGRPEKLSGAQTTTLEKTVTAEAGRHAVTADDGPKLAVRTESEAIRALAEGRDGNLYLLVHPETEPALDRFDPVLGKLDRLLLHLPKAQSLTSLAAGSDGLYLAGFTGEDGRYRIPWETLDAASWQAVEGARVNGSGD